MVLDYMDKDKLSTRIYVDYSDEKIGRAHV